MERFEGGVLGLISSEPRLVQRASVRVRLGLIVMAVSCDKVDYLLYI